MSVQAMTWAFEQDIRHSGTKLLLLALANRADYPTGRCWPSVPTLAREASMSVRQVQRLLPELERMGFIRIEKQTTGRVPKPSMYWLLLPGRQTGGGDSLTPPREQPGAAAPGDSLSPPPKATKRRNVTTPGDKDVTTPGDTAVTTKNRHRNRQKNHHPHLTSPDAADAAGLPKEGDRMDPTCPEPNAATEGDVQPITIDAFRSLWPASNLLSPHAVERHWRLLGDPDRRAAVAAVKPYLAECQAERRKVCDAATFLRDRRFERFRTTPAQPGCVAVPFGSPQHRAWRAYLTATKGPGAVRLMDNREAAGAEQWTFPAEWPPTGPEAPAPADDGSGPVRRPRVLPGPAPLAVAQQPEIFPVKQVGSHG